MKAKEFAFATISCLGRKTITGILTAQSEIVNDWSSIYRIFEKKRFCVEKLFQPIREYVISQLEENQPLTFFMDDTRIKKRGKKVYGTAWNRDPLGPKFQTNFIWGQRFLLLALALPSNKSSIGMARAIPFGFHHAPTLKKPKKNAPIEDWNKWKEESKKYKLPKIGINKLRILRNQLDSQGQSSRKIIASVDGGYTNITCIKNLPKRCILIGRIRKDAKIFKIPENEIHKKGRKKYYGDPLPTPEQFRQNSEIQWTQCEAFAAGKMHKFDIKVIKSFRWNGAGETNLTLIIVSISTRSP